MRLGLFGGSFDPVHNGHLLLAECCREQCRLDAVWFLPTAVPPHKQDITLSSVADRLAMLELATAGNPAFSVCRYETDRGGVNYTVDTLSHFDDEHPGWELFFLMGADMLLDLPRWRDAARVCELAVPIVVRRPGVGPLDFSHLCEIVNADRFELFRQHQVEMPEIGISATDLRHRVRSGQSIRYQVPHAVAMYIESHRVWR